MIYHWEADRTHTRRSDSLGGVDSHRRITLYGGGGTSGEWLLIRTGRGFEFIFEMAFGRIRGVGGRVFIIKNNHIYKSFVSFPSRWFCRREFLVEKVFFTTCEFSSRIFSWFHEIVFKQDFLIEGHFIVYILKSSVQKYIFFLVPWAIFGKTIPKFLRTGLAQRILWYIRRKDDTSSL
jgi:hypothetical protein